MADFPFMPSQRFTMEIEKSIDKSTMMLLVIAFIFLLSEVASLRARLKWQQVALKCF
jgi:hypothetical protein